MDSLSQRYGNPFLVLDDMIRLNQLHEFVLEIFDTIYEEKKEEYRWEFYLHKVFDKSWEEYVRLCDNSTESHSMSNEEVKNVVDSSRDILDLF